jgi:hypothetical protein
MTRRHKTPKTENRLGSARYPRCTFQDSEFFASEGSFAAASSACSTASSSSGITAHARNSTGQCRFLEISSVDSDDIETALLSRFEFHDPRYTFLLNSKNFSMLRRESCTD